MNHNEYKAETDEYEMEMEICSITDNECDGDDCRTCRVHRIQYQKYLRECYTNFERKSLISDVPIRINSSHVIAKTDMSTLLELQKKGVISETEVTYYHPDYIKQYSTDLRKLRSWNNLGIPDTIWVAFDRPGAFRFGDVIYLIAPMINLKRG